MYKSVSRLLPPFLINYDRQALQQGVHTSRNISVFILGMASSYALAGAIHHGLRKLGFLKETYPISEETEKVAQTLINAMDQGYDVSCRAFRQMSVQNVSIEKARYSQQHGFDTK